MPPADEGPRTAEPAIEAGRMLGLLWRSNHQLEMLSKRMIRALGVTGPQRMVLRIIARKPGVSAGGICETAQIHPSTLTGILERLARGGFIVRSRDGEDGRRARSEVTPLGLRVADSRRGTVESAIVQSLADFTPDERDVVRRWLSAFGDALIREQGVLGEREAADVSEVSDETATSPASDPPR